MKKWRILIISLVVVSSFVLVSAVSADTNYIVRFGDTLWGISRFYGTTPQAIQAANPKITNINLIYAGDTLIIPGDGGSGTGGQGEYIIRYGDTLSGIARVYGTTVQEILNVNPGITNPNLIYAGDFLILPPIAVPYNENGGSSGTGGQGKTVTPQEGEIHIVRTGENLLAIARTYNTTVEILMQFNPQIVNPDAINIGDSLKIPRG